MPSLIYILTVVFLFNVTDTLAKEVPFTLEDRDRLIRLEARLNEIDKRFESIDKRFESIERQIDRLSIELVVRVLGVMK